MSSPSFDPPDHAAGPRADWLDALRGFALLGILVINVQVFSGHAFREPLRALGLATVPATAVDALLHDIAEVLAQGKFYALFSFLFGLGIALQMQRVLERVRTIAGGSRGGSAGCSSSAWRTACSCGSATSWPRTRCWASGCWRSPGCRSVRCWPGR